MNIRLDLTRRPRTRQPAGDEPARDQAVPWGAAFVADPAWANGGDQLRPAALGAEVGANGPREDAGLGAKHPSQGPVNAAIARPLHGIHHWEHDVRGWITPVCECGWSGQAVVASSPARLSAGGS